MDPPSSFLDGGRLETRINGGGWNTVVPDDGYDATSVIGLSSAGWAGDSGGIVTDTAEIAADVGDTVEVRLRAGWWESRSVISTWSVQSITLGAGAGGDPAAVVARNLFYNNSFFDADDAPTAGEAAIDDGALATDKAALLPGEAATFANYSSYSLGINGIMVDIANLASEPTAESIGDYFEFTLGNDNTPDDWEAAAAPIEVTLRAGEGVDGSDRVAILWEDNSVQNGWLQTTVLSNDSTGLEAPEVFYFGNAIGDAGNSAADASVNAQDIGGARDNPHNFLNRALIDDAFDYNRDSLVNAQDIGIARDNPTNFLTDVNLISVPAVAPSIAAAFASLPDDASITQRVLPTQNLAVTASVSNSLSPEVFDETPRFDQRPLKEMYWWSSVSEDRKDPASDRSDPLSRGDDLLYADLTDLLAEDVSSLGRVR